MQDFTWLEKIERALPKIQSLALSCKEPFQQKCFELLLLAALQCERPDYQPAPPKQNSVSQGKKSNDNIPFTIEYQKFLEHFNLSHEKISNLMDFESGKIYTKKFGASVSSRQRLIASFLAILHCAKDGNLIVPKEELRQQCESFSSYDSKNFVKIMKTTTTNNQAIVFDDKGDFWKVTPPGEEYIKEMIVGILDN